MNKKCNVNNLLEIYTKDELKQLKRASDSGLDISQYKDTRYNPLGLKDLSDTDMIQICNIRFNIRPLPELSSSSIDLKGILLNTIFKEIFDDTFLIYHNIYKFSPSIVKKLHKKCIRITSAYIKAKGMLITDMQDDIIAYCTITGKMVTEIYVKDKNDINLINQLIKLCEVYYHCNRIKISKANDNIILACKKNHYDCYNQSEVYLYLHKED